MEKSIAFIESEFKRIGLEPLDGLKSFRQEFSHDMVTGTQATVSANNKSIDKRKIIVMSSRESLQLGSATAIHRIKKGDNAFQQFSKLSRDTTDGIVLVDTAHAKTFHAIQEWLGPKRILNSINPGSKVFLLSTDTVLTSVTVNISQKREKLLMTNVVGQIKAPKQTRESVIFSGHYDHIGIQPSIEGDSIANGADDDASGTTAVIVLADHFKKFKNLKRNLIFVAFTAEEIGGYGSRYFSSNLNPDDIVAMFNIEMIGKLSKWGANAAFISGFERSDFGSILQSNLKGSAVTFHPDPYPDQNLFYRSDNATLARLGVPAHTISTDQIDIDKLYHTVNDEFESIDINNMTEIIRAIAMSATSMVSGDAKPTRIDTSKVE
ncbi:MAG TPA: M20/M25/M40 family metallo-hydrolase [Chryseosolibacter sp.]